jgi:hypothetical protein
MNIQCAVAPDVQPEGGYYVVLGRMRRIRRATIEG